MPVRQTCSYNQKQNLKNQHHLCFLFFFSFFLSFFILLGLNLLRVVCWTICWPGIVTSGCSKLPQAITSFIFFWADVKLSRHLTLYGPLYKPDLKCFLGAVAGRSDFVAFGQSQTSCFLSFKAITLSLDKLISSWHQLLKPYERESGVNILIQLSANKWMCTVPKILNRSVKNDNAVSFPCCHPSTTLDTVCSGPCAAVRREAIHSSNPTQTKVQFCTAPN